MKIPGGDAKIVSLNSVGWSLVFSHRNPPIPQSQAPSQALTLLYIGGASSTSSLLSCQEVDGAGETRHVTILPS